MAKPTTITTWATDANATSDPGPTRRATGFVAGKKVPAKWLNWLFAQNGGWLTYLRDLDTEPEFLGKDYSWGGNHHFVSGSIANSFGVQGEILYADATGGVTPRLHTVLIEPCGLNGWDPNVMQSAGAKSQEPARNANGWGKIGLPVPSGGGLVRVRVGYERKAAGSDAQLYVRKTSPAKVAPFGDYPGLQLFQRGTTGTGQQVVDLGPVTDTLDSSLAVYALEIAPSGGRTQPLPDVVHWIEMQFLDPGPRNF